MLKPPPVYKWGVGPTLDGLFSQSNLGIVTRMTIWLMPAPPYFQAFFFQCDEDNQLAPLIEALRPLRLSGALRSTVHIANDYKVLSSLQQYPWEETGGSVPLLPSTMLELRRRLKFGAWSASGRFVRHSPPGCRSAPYYAPGAKGQSSAAAISR